MSYERNKITYFLERNSNLIVKSKSTSSVYYYLGFWCVRYSNHFSRKSREGVIQIVRRSNRVLMIWPGQKEYQRFTEKNGFWKLRKILKKGTRKPPKDLSYANLLKYKRRCREKTMMKNMLRTFKNEDLKTLNMRIEQE